MPEITAISHNGEDKTLQGGLLGKLIISGAQVVVAPEGYFVTDSDEALEKAVALVESYGYEVHLIPYHTRDGREDDYGYMVAVKGSLHAIVEPLPSVQRNFVRIRLNNLDIIGVHLDDRQMSTRALEVDALLKEIAASGRRTVVMGDFNSDHHDSSLGRILQWLHRPIEWLVKLGLEVDPGETYRQEAPQDFTQWLVYKIGKYVSLARRLRDMTSPDNRVLEMFEEAGFVDGDPDHVPTRMLGGRFGVQLDHVLHPEDVDVTVMVGDGKPSDHDIVVATLTY